MLFDYDGFRLWMKGKRMARYFVATIFQLSSNSELNPIVAIKPFWNKSSLQRNIDQNWFDCFPQAVL
ncbi:MAG: hypothetical protein EB164_06110 [Thaumarchaeota archaeon]|nr:hypothetical protein [Nitrososphaerota archaeon]